MANAWIDNADGYICPECRTEVNNPAHHGYVCPRCGFVADQDKDRVNLRGRKWFRILYRANNIMRNDCRIVEDMETGVQYIVLEKDKAVSICPRYNADGSLCVSKE